VRSFGTKTALAEHLEVAGRNSRPHREYLEKIGFDSGDVLFGVDLKKLAKALQKSV
jgi:hypothetical protein